MKKVLKLRKKYIILFAVLLLIVSGGLFLSKDRALKGNVDINKLLETSDYAYLPTSAKFYIQKMYKETGTVVLTEKNKKPGVPYLNPKYVEYLEASPEEREKYSLIPSNIIVDYKYNKKIYKSVTNPNLPNKYDLRDDGYVSPIKNQGNLDLCWAFSANSQLESLLLKNGITATFSERQLDYATSSNGINNYVSEYNIGKRRLGGGGNYVGAVVPMMNGVGTVSSASFPYNENNSDKKELYEVLNFANSQYEVNSGINMVTLDVDTASPEEISSYVDIVKTNVMEYGGAFIGTSAPTYGCSHYDEDNDTYLIRNDGICADAPHGMHIIGWDDDYEYTYCVNGNTHEALTPGCSAENTVTGKGAWLVKNSWGDGEPYTYVYVAYDSYDTAISLVTDVAPTSEKTWDNVYSFGADTRGYFQEYGIAYDGFASSTFGNYNEKVEKVKFITLTENASFNVTIKFEDESKPTGYAEYKKTINTTLPGLQIVDFSDLDINITSDSVEVMISEVNIMDDNYFALPFYLYTSNLDNDVHIRTDDTSYANSLNTQNGDDYKVAVYSVTKNLPSNAEVDYKLYDSEETEIPITYENNYVAENNVLTTITIPNNASVGTYTLKTLYNDVEYATSDVNLDVEVSAIEGSGTSADPYLIKTPSDLQIINEDMEASYALANDLDFQGDTIEPIGLSTGMGFTGTFDGQGHTIKNLYINGANGSNEYQYSGLFAGITSNDHSPVIVKDIVLENVNSYTDYYNLLQGDAGILAGIVTDCDDDHYCGLNDVTISDIVVTGDNPVEVGLVGTVYVSKVHGVSFNNIYMDSVVEYHNGFNGSLVSYLERVYATDGSVLATNIQNMSSYQYYSYDYGYNYYDLYNNYYAGLFGYLYSDVTIENFISNTNFHYEDNDTSNTYHGLLAGMYESGNISISNAYYVNEENLFGNDSNYNDNGVIKKTANELVDESLYTNWTAFADNWEINNDDSINRLPVLKSATDRFVYTDISPITLVVNQELPIDEIFGYDQADIQSRWDHGITIVDNNGVINISDGKLIGLSHGNATINIYNTYDGYSKDVEITVTDDAYIGTVTFNSNLEPNTTYEQEINLSNKNLGNIQFSKTGYKLKEWNTQADGNGVSYAANATLSADDFENEALELFAIWEPITYNVHFVYDYVYTTQVFTYDSSDTLEPFSSDVPDGYKFDYWSLTDDDSVTFDDEEEVINLTTVDNDDIFLIAHIKPIEYTVRFNNNDGTNNSSESNYIYTQDITLPNNPTRTGYTFAGWNTDIAGSGSVITNGSRGLTIVDGSTVDVYAQWEPITYTIKFIDEDEEKTQTFTYDVEQQLAEYTFTKTGYTFDGWVSNNVNYFPNQTVINLTDHEEELVFEATYTPNRYFIIYDANTGTGSMDTVFLMYDQEYQLDENLFTKTGHQFDSWNTKADGSGDSYEDEGTVVNLSAVSESEVRLYAQWAPAGYKVEFNANGGEGTMSKQTFYYGTEANLKANTFTRVGYTFAGWNTQADGNGNSYTDEQAVLNLVDDDSTVKLYAQWTPITYTIAFNSNDGEGSMESQVFTYDVVGTLNENTFTRNHYNFVGWNTQSNGEGTSYADEAEINNITATSETITLYAQWEVIRYNVTFDSNGGTGEMPDQVFTYISQALSSNIFEKTGYIFDSWNTQADGNGNGYDNEEEITVEDNITLFAIWAPISYTVQFDGNGGTGTVEAINATYGVAFNMPANSFEKTGYTFAGWNSQADGQGTDYEIQAEVQNLAEDDGDVVIIYAKWSPISYTVVYDGNGGTGSMESSQHNYGEEFTLSENTITKTGYTFTGWDTQADGEGIDYADGQSVSNLTTEAGSVTLYAQWSPITYTIHFDLVGGNGEISDITATYDVAVRQNSEPTKTGYTFTGWNSQADGNGDTYTKNTDIVNLTTTEGTVTLYAMYTANTYTVNFNGNGGEGSMESIVCTYDQDCQLPENAFTKVEGEGENEVTYEIKEWNTVDDGSGNSYKDKAAVKNIATSGEITLYVIWRVEVAYGIEEYIVDDENDLTNIERNTSVEDFIGRFTVGNKYSVKVYSISISEPGGEEVYTELGEEDLVGTGTRTVIYLGIDPVAEYDNIVRGDIDGDGYVDIADVAMLYRHIKNKAQITGDDYLKAAEIDGDEGYNIGDVSKLYRYIKGKVSTLY